jgi:TolA-binding protein
MDGITPFEADRLRGGTRPGGQRQSDQRQGMHRGGVGRRRRALGQLWQVPTFLFGLFAFILVAASSPFRGDWLDGAFTRDLQALRAELHEGAASESTLARADRLVAQLAKHPRKAAEVHFLAGSAYFHHAEAYEANADGAADANVAASRGKAREHLEEALALNVPAADVPELHYRLGMTLYQDKDDLGRAIAFLSQAVDAGAGPRAETYRLLVDASLALPTPDVDGALAFSKKLLEVSADPDAVGETRLLRGTLLVRKQQRVEAIKELDRIGNNVSPALRVKARLMQADICKDEGLWHRGAAVWKELSADATLVPGGKGRVLYELGHCYASVEPSKQRDAAQVWSEALALGGPEAQAARLRLGDIKLYGGKEQSVEALQLWQAALSDVAAPKDYRNQYLPLSKARAMLDQACAFFLDRGDYNGMETAAALFQKLSAPGVADQRLAEAAEAQAQRLQKSAGSRSEPTIKQQIKVYFERAGAAYRAAGDGYAGAKKIEPYWRSALCFLAAGANKQAAEVLESYVAIETDEPRLAQAFYSLAEAATAQGQRERARQAYYKCMEFPSTPYAYRARYQLAVEQMEQKNFTHAKEILKQNLTAASPAMDRDAHEKSLYKMAWLLVQLHVHDEAAWYLKEATRQYPNHPAAFHARDLLAESYRKLAEHAKEKLGEIKPGNLETLSPERRLALEEVRTHHARTHRLWLDLALETYQASAAELEQRSRKGPLAAPELVILRRALFGIADVRFERNEFHEALRLYQELQQRYPKQVEGLIACERIWRCVGVIASPPDQARFVREAAKAAVQAALADLKAMNPASEQFHGPGVWAHQEWQQWLAWVSEQLASAETPAARPNPLIQ